MSTFKTWFTIRRWCQRCVMSIANKIFSNNLIGWMLANATLASTFTGDACWCCWTCSKNMTPDATLGVHAELAVRHKFLCWTCNMRSVQFLVCMTSSSRSHRILYVKSGAKEGCWRARMRKMWKLCGLKCTGIFWFTTFPCFHDSEFSSVVSSFKHAID